jgi:hypothetical protein
LIALYVAKVKVGNIIAVHGARPSVGTSTIAAMTAAMLAARGEKTLLLSTDSDVPFDAVSMSSDIISESHMDELVMLETSTGLTPDDLVDYVTFVSDELGVIQAATNLTRISKSPARTLINIIDNACYEFRYIVVDIGYANTPYANQIYQHSDLVMHILGRDAKTISQVAEFYHRGGFGEDKLSVPIIAGYTEDYPIDIRALEKKLDVEEIFTIGFCDDIYKTCVSRNLTDYVYKCVKRKGGLFNLKKKKVEEDVTPVDELTAICNLMIPALKSEADGEKEE